MTRRQIRAQRQAKEQLRQMPEDLDLAEEESEEAPFPLSDGSSFSPASPWPVLQHAKE